LILAGEHRNEFHPPSAPHGPRLGIFFLSAGGGDFLAAELIFIPVAAPRYNLPHL